VSRVIAVARDDGHHFSKPTRPEINLLAGIGVEGDAHAGATVKHRSRVRRDATTPNLRQVHLIQSELLEELGLEPGTLGENITTTGVELFDQSAGTLLRLGDTAVVELTGYRNPCVQIERFRPGLMTAVMGRDSDGVVVLRGGVMAVVRESGTVRAGDVVQVEAPAGFVPMHRV
jgi:MOSC domain-containing protein YiiM